MNPIVVKFGGSSLATAGQFEKVAAIIRENPGRRYVVASAPGKRFSGDTKVTDLLYRCYDAACAGQDFAPALDEIRQRFADIISELQLQVDLAPDFAAIEAHLRTSPQRDYMASRGEYLNSRLLAAYLGFAFVDAAQMVLFRADGSFDAEATNTAIGHALVSIDRAVIPGFYGAMPDGTIHTFSRGGSDVTGSIVARAVGAELYENWTDVSGVLAADPRIIEHPHVVDYITYRELRELSYMGASVLHEDAVFPVRRANIPINIRNTNRPQDPGTFIVPTLPANAHKRKVTGIAGHKGFSSVYVEKSMMNGEIGFVAHLLQIFADHGISFEHCPSGIDTVSIIVSTEALAPAREEILRRIQDELQPDHVSVEDGLALIAVVGQGMIYAKGTAARIFRVIADANINIRMIDQGSCELNIIIAVKETDYELAIRSLYHAVERVM